MNTKSILSICLFGCIPFSGICDDIKSDFPTTPPIKIKKPGTGDYPRVPAKVVITAWYQDGTLTFAGVENFGTMAATVTNDLTGECRSAFIDETSPEMEVSTDAGSYTICLTTLDGQELYGYYTL